MGEESCKLNVYTVPCQLRANLLISSLEIHQDPHIHSIKLSTLFSIAYADTNSDQNYLKRDVDPIFVGSSSNFNLFTNKLKSRTKHFHHVGINYANCAPLKGPSFIEDMLRDERRRSKRLNWFNSFSRTI